MKRAWASAVKTCDETSCRHGCVPARMKSGRCVNSRVSGARGQWLVNLIDGDGLPRRDLRCRAHPKLTVLSAPEASAAGERRLRAASRGVLVFDPPYWS